MHTPTPWTTHEGNEGWRITNEHNQTIADCDYGTTEDTNPPTNETKANAALIVKAVNSYEAMRAALKGAQNDINFHGGKLSGGTIDAIKKALTLAE